MVHIGPKKKFNKSDEPQKGHLGCSAGYSFNIYKQIFAIRNMIIMDILQINIKLNTRVWIEEQKKVIKAKSCKSTVYIEEKKVLKII